MMVQVITAQIGKAGDMDVQAVKTMLGQAMAACLECQMRDAGATDRLQGGMQADSIWRCQRRQAEHPALHRSRVRPLQSQRADRSGVPGRAAPDLAQELNCRSLAIGAGDGGDHAWLSAPETRRGKRQFPARRGAGQDRHAALGDGVQRGVERPLIGQDGSGAGRDGGGREIASIGMTSGKRGEQEPRAGLT